MVCTIPQAIWLLALQGKHAELRAVEQETRHLKANMEYASSDDEV